MNGGTKETWWLDSRVNQSLRDCEGEARGPGEHFSKRNAPDDLKF